MRSKIFFFAVILVVAPAVSYAAPAPSAQVIIAANGHSGSVSVGYNEQVSVQWNSANALNCVRTIKDENGSVIDQLSVPTNGPGGEGGRFTSSRTYTLVCRNPDGIPVSDSVSISVGAKPLLFSSVDLKANGIDSDVFGGNSVTIPSGGKLRLSWTSDGASYCTLTGYDESGQSVWNGQVTLNGSTSGTLKAPRTYVFTCTNSDGTSRSDTIKIKIGNPAVSASQAPVACTMINGNLKYGAKDAEVTVLQRFLYDKGYLSVIPTGYFGDMTVSAVKKLQKEYGLSQTGSLSDETRARIKKLSCK